MHRENKRYHYQGQWKNGFAEIEDLALDFIAPLFARDESGVFVELQKYFSTSWDLSDREFKEVVYQLLNSVIQQQSIRLFKERDPFGKTFYRSLRYLQNKHENWNRTFINGYLVIAPSSGHPDIMHPDTLVLVLKQCLERHLSLTEQIEQVLNEVIENRQQAVSVEDLLTHTRVLAELTLEGMSPKTSPAVDSFIYNVIESHIKKTVQEVDRTVLSRYETDGKLSSAERESFRKSIQAILIDHADGGCKDNYFQYLSGSLKTLESQELYKQTYRAQFEYVAKKAKSLFSAKVENALSMK